MGRRGRREDPAPDLSGLVEQSRADEVRAELEAHIEGSVDLLVARGWTEAGARREVERRFGDARRHVAELERLARRRALRLWLRRGRRMLVDALGTAARDVARFPGLAMAVIAILVVGIGVNGAVFRIVDGLLLSPPAQIDRASEVRRLHQTVRYETRPPHTIDSFTWPDVAALRTAGGARIGAIMQSMPETLGEGEGATRVRVSRVDSAFLPLLGVHAVLGRGFVADDHVASAVPVALLAHGLWANRYGSDPAVVGRAIRVGRADYQVIGVLPKRFLGAQAPATDVWVPLESTAPSLWGAGWRDDRRILAFRVLARLDGSSPADAWAARVEAVLRRGRPAADPPGELINLTTSSLVPASAPDPGSIVSVSRWVAGVALLVLFVACANAANLFLAHGERTRRATAVRLALGATAGRLRLELLARAVLLALLAGAGAGLVAVWGGSLLEHLFLGGMELPSGADTPRLVGFTGCAALLAGLLTGIMPALRAPAAGVRSALERGGRITGATAGVRRVLVALQVALSMLLLVGAGLFVASLHAAFDVDLGFDPDRLVMVRLEQETGEAQSRTQLYDEAERRLRDLPRIAAVTPSVGVPFVLLYGLSGGLPGEPDAPGLTIDAVGPDYFRALGTGVAQGRALERADLQPGAPPVAVVGVRTAARLWPGMDPIGRCLRVGPEDAPCTRVVGVAPEHAGVSWTADGLVDDGSLQAWVAAGHPAAAAPSALLVRTDGPADAVVPDIRRVLASAPAVRFVETGTMREFVGRSMRAWRLGATVFTLFGVIALAVAAIGVYGVLAFEVAQRRREYGIRLALGAGRLRVMAPVVRIALPMIGGGLLCGALAAALGAARIRTLLFEVSPLDPRIFALAAALLVVTAAAALLVPAWRAGGVEARDALASE